MSHHFQSDRRVRISTAKRLLFNRLKQSDDNTVPFKGTVLDLMDELNASKRCIHDYLAVLERQGWIKVNRQLNYIEDATTQTTHTDIN